MPEHEPLMREDLDPPLILSAAQVREMVGMIENGAERQTIYAYMTDGSGDVLVGNAEPETPEAEGDGVWMNIKGAEMYGPVGFKDGTTMGGRHDDPPHADAESTAEEISDKELTEGDDGAKT